MRKNQAKILALTALLAAFGAALGYIDAILPTLDFIPLPGVKLGLANLATLAALYLLGWQYAAAVSLVRVLLVNLLLFPSATALAFSLAGGALALCGMIVMQKTGFHILCVSVAGAALHNVAQLGVAAAVFSSPAVLYYAIFLFPLGILTGALLGLLSALILPRAKRALEKNAP